MKKHTIIKTVVVIIFLIVCILTMFFADINKILENKSPVFSLQKQIYEDKTEEYIGFGYKIFKIVDGEEIKVKIGTIFSSYDSIK